MKRTWGQLHLVDEPTLIHQQVELVAVEIDPLAGDIPPINPFWGYAGARCTDVFADGDGEGL